MAAGDIVPVPGAQFEETLASASPDLLRAMIREGGPSLSRHRPLGGRMTAERARPPPDCRQIVVRLRYGVKGGCDRWPMSSGNSAWSTYTQSRP